MIEIADYIIKKNFGSSAEEIGKIENVSNNFVYSFRAAGERFILKMYRSKDWPEDGKIPFVNRLVLQNNIPCAELIAYSRDDQIYPNGYLIEREIQGTAADKIRSGREKEAALYVTLAELVSKVHNIRIKNFGYIGSGEGCYESMSDFF